MSIKKSLKVGIIGAGNIGTKRAHAILDLGQDKIVGIFDTDREKMQTLVSLTASHQYSSAQQLLSNPEIDAVIISAIPKANLKLVQEALQAKKHVLVEKPLGSTKAEAVVIDKAAKKAKRVVKVGFNHRFHPALLEAYKQFSQGSIGELMCIRSIYGHGARPGYDLEWRMQKKFSRGGELYDQGVHILDLAQWFAGDAEKVFATNRNLYWKKSQLEDNAFCQLFYKTGKMMDFHVSLTQWKNKFSFEIFGTKGYLLVSGLGRSYGLETLVLGTNVGQGKVPSEKVWEFPGPDNSWAEEWKHFRACVLDPKKPVMSSAGENAKVMANLDALYASASKQKIIKL